MIKFILDLLYKLIVSVDQFFNVLLLGDPDETYSSRLYRERDTGEVWYTGRAIVDFCFFWQPDHTKESFIHEYDKRVKFIEDHAKERERLRKQ